MEKTVNKIPFLRISIALAAGIVLNSWIQINTVFVYLTLAFLVGFIIFFNTYYKYRISSLFGFLIHALFVVTGIFFSQNFNKTPFFYEKGKYLATVREAPQERQNSYKSELTIFAFHQNNSVFKTKEKVIVYFEKTENAKKLKAGENILFIQTPQFIKNSGNPFEFDYSRYLRRKKIYRQLYLPANNWEISKIHKSLSISDISERTREKLLEIYRNQNLGSAELQILSALTLGYKRELDPEIKQVFSNSGAMHVLAVSGLHVGIIYWIILVSLGFLKKRKKGRAIFAVIAILSLWIFAFITGLSPSVERASIMFSFIIIGENLKRQTNIYNSLAASALILLLINPNNLFEVGFQLSYSAVFGIVYLQPKISKIFTFHHSILKFFWSLLSVSIAAQIATFPIAIFYFKQFPTYFWVSNLFVIPAATILIPLGILLLVLSKIHLVSAIVAGVINFIIHLQYSALKFIESLPFSTIELAIQPLQFTFLIICLFSVFIFLKNKKPHFILISLTSLLLLVSAALALKINQLNKKEIIVYNSQSNTVIHFISGYKNYVVTQLKIEESDFENQIIKNTCLNLHLPQPLFITINDSLKNEDILIKNGIIYFEKKLIIYNSEIKNLSSDFPAQIRINPNNLDLPFTPENATIVHTQKTSTVKNQKNHSIFFTKTQGAFRLKL